MINPIAILRIVNEFVVRFDGELLHDVSEEILTMYLVAELSKQSHGQKVTLDELQTLSGYTPTQFINGLEGETFDTEIKTLDEGLRAYVADLVALDIDLALDVADTLVGKSRKDSSTLHANLLNTVYATIVQQAYIQNSDDVAAARNKARVEVHSHSSNTLPSSTPVEKTVLEHLIDHNNGLTTPLDGSGLLESLNRHFGVSVSNESTENKDLPVSANGIISVDLNSRDPVATVQDEYNKYHGRGTYSTVHNRDSVRAVDSIIIQHSLKGLFVDTPSAIIAKKHAFNATVNAILSKFDELSGSLTNSSVCHKSNVSEAFSRNGIELSEEQLEIVSANYNLWAVNKKSIPSYNRQSVTNAIRTDSFDIYASSFWPQHIDTEIKKATERASDNTQDAINSGKIID